MNGSLDGLAQTGPLAFGQTRMIALLPTVAGFVTFQVWLPSFGEFLSIVFQVAPPWRDSQIFTVVPAPALLQRIVCVLPIVHTAPPSGAITTGGGAVLRRIETLSPSAFAAARSSLPSRLKSPATSADGVLPTANGEPKAVARKEEKPPSPSPISIDTLSSAAFPTARSSLPSPSQSAAATDEGELPTLKFTAAANVPSPFPSKTETLPLPLLATARSGMPSPSKSPMATAEGVVPTPNGDPRGCVKLPSPTPSRIDTPPPELTTAKSGTPSRSKSPAASAIGPVPTP